MPRITIRPVNQVVEAEEGATIMEAAWESLLYWPTTCGGQGMCTSCACSVEEGAENLDEMGRSERRTLTRELGESTIRERRLRLACQARVHGDVTVSKRGVRPARP
jgi:2Fe-2S ferredoxin